MPHQSPRSVRSADTPATPQAASTRSARFAARMSKESRPTRRAQDKPKRASNQRVKSPGTGSAPTVMRKFMFEIDCASAVTHLTRSVRAESRAHDMRSACHDAISTEGDPSWRRNHWSDRRTPGAQHVVHLVVDDRALTPIQSGRSQAPLTSADGTQRIRTSLATATRFCFAQILPMAAEAPTSTSPGWCGRRRRNRKEATKNQKSRLNGQQLRIRTSD